MIRLFKDGKPTWIGLVVVLGLVLFALWDMGVPGSTGWGFLLLCLLVGLAGGLVFLFGLNRIGQFWSGLPRSRRLLLVLLVAAAFMVAGFISNHGKPDESTNNLLTVMGVLFGLFLLGLYSVFSRALDKLWIRLTK